MCYYSFSYWQPRDAQHYIGWVSAASHVDAFEDLRELLAITGIWYPREVDMCSYHPRGHVYQVSTEASVHAAWAKAWETGAIPESGYLFLSKDSYWTFNSDFWHNPHIDMYETLDAEGYIKSRVAYVIPPLMKITALDMSHALPFVTEQERLHGMLCLYPGHTRKSILQKK